MAKRSPKSVLEALAQQYARAGRPVSRDMQAQLREELIAREVFAQAAVARGLDATDDYKNQFELTKQSLPDP